MPAIGLLLAVAFVGAPPAGAVTKYDAYVHAIDDRPLSWNWPQELRNGQVVVEPGQKDADTDLGGSLIHDWIGSAFIPGVTLAQVASFLQDYPSHQNYYRPEVVDTRVIRHDGDDWITHYRLVKHYIVTVVLDVDQTVHYTPIGKTRLCSSSEATRIAEVRAKPGRDRGYLWRLNTWWRLEEKDGGVYAQCEMVSLTRAAPLGLGWIVNPIIRTMPRDSLARLVAATRNAVLSRR